MRSKSVCKRNMRSTRLSWRPQKIFRKVTVPSIEMTTKMTASSETPNMGKKDTKSTIIRLAKTWESSKSNKIWRNQSNILNSSKASLKGELELRNAPDLPTPERLQSRKFQLRSRTNRLPLTWRCPSNLIEMWRLFKKATMAVMKTISRWGELQRQQISRSNAAITRLRKKASIMCISTKISVSTE